MMTSMMGRNAYVLPPVSPAMQVAHHPIVSTPATRPASLYKEVDEKTSLLREQSATRRPSLERATVRDSIQHGALGISSRRPLDTHPPVVSTQSEDANQEKVAIRVEQVWCHPPVQTKMNATRAALALLAGPCRSSKSKSTKSDGRTPCRYAFPCQRRKMEMNSRLLHTMEAFASDPQNTSGQGLDRSGDHVSPTNSPITAETQLSKACAEFREYLDRVKDGIDKCLCTIDGEDATNDNCRDHNSNSSAVTTFPDPKNVDEILPRKGVSGAASTRSRASSLHSLASIPEEEAQMGFQSAAEIALDKAIRELEAADTGAV